MNVYDTVDKFCLSFFQYVTSPKKWKKVVTSEENDKMCSLVNILSFSSLVTSFFHFLGEVMYWKGVIQNFPTVKKTLTPIEKKR